MLLNSRGILSPYNEMVAETKPMRLTEQVKAAG